MKVEIGNPCHQSSHHATSLLIMPRQCRNDAIRNSPQMLLRYPILVDDGPKSDNQPSSDTQAEGLYHMNLGIGQPLFISKSVPAPSDLARQSLPEAWIARAREIAAIVHHGTW
jgi:hypothetical protein